MQQPRWARLALVAEAGFTLVEMLWVMALSLMVLGAAMLVLTAALNDTNTAHNRVGANDQVTRTLERITREIRQATYVGAPSNGGSTLVLHVYVNSSSSTPDTITWNCGNVSAGRYYCTRTDGAGTPTTEITGLTSSNVFTQGSLPLDTSTSANDAKYTPITVTLSQAVSGAANHVLSELVTARNCQYANSPYNQSCDSQ